MARKVDEIQQAQDRFDAVARTVQEEIEHACAKHPAAWPSLRHGHSVIEEEYTEFRDALFADRFFDARAEVVQLAASCFQYLLMTAPGIRRAKSR